MNSQSDDLEDLQSVQSSTDILSYDESQCIDYEDLLPPGYSCTVSKAGIVRRKLEFENIATLSSYRQWHNVYISIQGTLCSIYRLNCPEQKKKDSNKEKNNRGSNNDNVFIEIEKSKDASDSISDSCISSEQRSKEYDSESENVSALTLIRKYSLAYGQAGLAVDYLKKSNCIRVRLENIQFLLSFHTSVEAVSWIEAFQCGINIALDLDNMNLPHFAALSRRRMRNHQQHERTPLAPVSISRFHGNNHSLRTWRSSTFGTFFKNGSATINQSQGTQRGPAAITGSAIQPTRAIYIANPNTFQRTQYNADFDDSAANSLDNKSVPFTLSFASSQVRANTNTYYKLLRRRTLDTRQSEKAHVSVLQAGAPYEKQIIINGSQFETLELMPTSNLSVPHKIKGIKRIFSNFTPSSLLV